MGFSFEYDPRLNLEVPQLERDWEEFPEQERQKILERWENIRGQIPGRIAEFEQKIGERQERLQNEEDWDTCLALMDEISDFASRINDLNILFRTHPDAVLDDTEEQADRPETANSPVNNGPGPGRRPPGDGPDSRPGPRGLP